MPENHTPKLINKVIKGSVWLIAVRLITKIVDLIVLLIFARIMNPSDFGLMALAMAFIYIVEAVLEMPLITALIRLPEITKGHLDTVFTLSLIRGFLLSIIIIIIAWPYSQIYQDPRLFPLMSALSVAPAARGISNPNLVHKVKAINFSIYFTIDGFGKLFSAALSISVAVYTNSYWAIALYTISAPVTSSVLSFVIMPHKPTFTLVAWRDIAEFLGWNSLSQVLSAINWQLDRLVLGRIIPHSTFGRYTLASDIAALPEQSLVKPIVAPLIAGFATANRDIIKLKLAYAKSASAIYFVGLPVMLGLSAMAGTAIKVGLGDKWADAVPMLRWLSLSLALPLASVPLTALASALDRPQLLFQRAAVESIIKIPLICGLFWINGLWGAIAARVITDTVMSVVSMLMAKHLIEISIFEQIKYLWRPTISALIMYIFLLSADVNISSSSGLELIGWSMAIVVTGSLLYAFLLTMFWVACGSPQGLEYTLVTKIESIIEKRGKT